MTKGSRDAAPAPPIEAPPALAAPHDNRDFRSNGDDEIEASTSLLHFHYPCGKHARTSSSPQPRRPSLERLATCLCVQRRHFGMRSSPLYQGVVSHGINPTLDPKKLVLLSSSGLVVRNHTGSAV